MAGRKNNDPQEPKEERWNVRIKGPLAQRFIEACKIARMDEPLVLRALAEAFTEQVEAAGGVWMPLAVVPKTPDAKNISYLSTEAVEPTARAAEDPPPPEKTGRARRPKTKGTRATS